MLSERGVCCATQAWFIASPPSREVRLALGLEPRGGTGGARGGRNSSRDKGQPCGAPLAAMFWEPCHDALPLFPLARASLTVGLDLALPRARRPRVRTPETAPLHMRAMRGKSGFPPPACRARLSTAPLIPSYRRSAARVLTARDAMSVMQRRSPGISFSMRRCSCSVLCRASTNLGGAEIKDFGWPGQTGP